MRILLDAMGSDQHPVPEVEAAIQAAEAYGEPVLLVGDSEILDPLIGDKRDRIQVVHAPEVFKTTDALSGRQLRSAKNSIGVAYDLMKNDEGDAFVTAGNTGAAMAIGLARVGRIPGIKRPALIAPFPVRDGTCIVTDVGANTECKPEFLVQFAIMGSVYAELILGIDKPRVGLVSNGEEAGKGNDLVKETYPLLEESGLNFIGNVEGKEIFGGEVDVAVTDGFTGNVLMKGAEAAAGLMTDELRQAIRSSFRTSLGGLIAKPAFDMLKEKLDPGSIGAVPLLGLDGLVFVGHGRSDSRAILNSIKLARHSVELDLISSIRENLGVALK